MPILTVALPQRSYDINIGSGLLGQAGKVAGEFAGGRKIILVSNPTVYGLYGEQCRESLVNSGFEVILSLMPDGEEYKNITEVLKIVDAAVKGRIERTDLLIALGGGVVGDAAGFAAAIYQRGIDFIQIPTTLLAQVDSSVGGKVGVNHFQGKNLLGAFHQPRSVIIDTDVLKTLALRDYLSGLAEVIKYGLIYDEEFFAFLEARVPAIIDQEEETLQKIIYRSCQIKSAIVAADEREAGLRAVLNLGHTFGHAVEKLGDYKAYRHGEAVAIGINAAVHLAAGSGLMTAGEAGRVRDLMDRLSLPMRFPDFAPEDIIAIMHQDKKSKKGRIYLVLPRGIGDYVITDNITEEQLVKAIKEAQK